MRLFADATCQLGGGTVVTPGSLRPWLDEAWVERLDFDGPSRVVDVGCAVGCSRARPDGRWR